MKGKADEKRNDTMQRIRHVKFVHPHWHVRHAVTLIHLNLDRLQTRCTRTRTLEGVDATLAQVREQNQLAGRVKQGVEAHQRPLQVAVRRLLGRLRILERHKVEVRIVREGSQGSASGSGNTGKVGREEAKERDVQTT